MPDYKFWNERWLNNQIGFHMKGPHQSLVEFIDVFSRHQKVLVPLCGKSPDLLFLREYGLEVIGVEFSEVAVLDFIKENNLKMNKIKFPHINLYEGEGFKIYQGDLFHLSEIELAGVTCCYDRASMVAFNSEERIRYSIFQNKLKELSVILAVLLDYGDFQDAGPPFSVRAEELWALYGKDFLLKMVKTTEIPLREHFKGLSISYEKEVSWLLKRK